MRLWAALLGSALAAGAPLLSPAPRRSRVRVLAPRALSPGLRGKKLARLSLSGALDALTRAGEVKLGGRRWRFGLAADARFERCFVVVSDGTNALFQSVGEPRALSREGVVLTLPGGLSYRFRLRPRRASPVMESLLVAETLDGRAAASWTTGELIEGLLTGATRLRTSDGDVWLAYLSDRAPETGGPAGTRSLLFFQPRRFIPKAWRLPASALSPRGVVVTLKRARISLRVVGEELLVEEVPELNSGTQRQ